MPTDLAAQSETIVLGGIPWDTYQRILEAIGEYHLRHTYDQGMLEMWRVLHGVSWEDYQKLLDAMADITFPHTYDRGTLEMMSPRKDHDWIKGLIGRMIEAMCFTLDIPIQTVGSTTLGAAAAERGLQPDEAYYVANEPEVRGKDTYTPDVDPPPDLAVEVDVTSNSLGRLPIYAAIGVPEIWRHDADQLRFHALTPDGEYREIERSLAFPFVSPADVQRCLDRRTEMGENAIVRLFVEWAEQAAN